MRGSGRKALQLGLLGHFHRYGSSDKSIDRGRKIKRNWLVVDEKHPWMADIVRLIRTLKVRHMPGIL